MSGDISSVPRVEAAGIDSQIAGEPPARRRPVPVTILAILQLLAALGYGLTCAALLSSGTAALAAITGMSEVTVTELGPVGIGVALAAMAGGGVIALAAAILLLRMHRLGWTIAMLLAGLGLATSIWFWWTAGAALTAWLVIQVATVFYLNQRQTRQAFGISERTVTDVMRQGRG